MKLKRFLSFTILLLLLIVIKESVSLVFDFLNIAKKVFAQESTGSEDLMSKKVWYVDKDKSVYDLGAGKRKLVIQSGQNYYDKNSSAFKQRDNKFYDDVIGEYTNMLENDFLVRINKNSLLPYKIEKDGFYVVFEPQKANMSYAEISDNTAYYKDVWNNIDVELSVLDIGIKEYLIIKNADADTVFRYKIISNAIFFDDGKGISCVQNGNEIFHIPDPESFDAKGNKVDVLYHIYQESGFYYLEFAIGKGYEYPVIIDPIVVISDVSKVEDACIWADMPDTPQGTGYYHYLGNFNSTTYRWNILFRLKNHGIPIDATIDSALLKLYIYLKTPSSGSNTMFVKMYNVRPARSWVESEVTWNVYKIGSSWTTAGALDTTSDIYGSECVLDTIEWKGVAYDSIFLNITNLMKKWAGKDSVHSNQGFMVRRDNYNADSLRFNFRSKEYSSGYHPAFIIYYNSYLTLDVCALSEHSIGCSSPPFLNRRGPNHNIFLPYQRPYAYLPGFLKQQIQE
jgi:hypothetical protein